MALHKGLIGKDVGGGSVGFDRIPAVHMPVNVPQSDKTLSDYIQRKVRQEAFDAVALENQVNTTEEKISFETWWEQNWFFIKDTLRQTWKAAQENVPSQAPGTGA